MKWNLFQELWINKKRTLTEVVDEKKETHTRGCG
jgi:hypothetical protein